MLAHLHDFDLSFDLKDLNRFDVLLSHYLHCDLEASSLVSCKLDLAELSLTYGLLEIVKVLESRLTDRLLHLCHP